MKYLNLNFLIIISNCVLFLSCEQREKKETPRPNILFVFPDQMRVQTLGFRGEEPVITPNLDSFAKESMVFSNAVSNSPVCSPFRAMLFSGKYPVSNGVITNTTSLVAKYDIQLKTNERTWSDILKTSGYSLGYIGKWHLEYPYAPFIDCSNNQGAIKWNEWSPPERRHGFDYWYAYNTYDQHLRPMYWSTDATRNDFHYVDQWGPEHEADMAIKYIKNEDGSFRDKDEPFALVVAMNPPHMPYKQVPQRYVDMYDDKEDEISALIAQPSVPDSTDRWGKYYRKHIKNQLAMVTGVDEQFGRILQALEENGLKENTIVVFTSDHGDCLGKHGKISKSNPYEEAWHIPFIISWLGKINQGTDDLLLSTPDIYPTLLELAGLQSAIPKDVEGLSFAPLLTGNTIDRPSSQLYFMTRGQLSKRDREQHSKNFTDLTIGERGIRTQRYTLYIERFAKDSSNVWLWDRQSDPYMMENIAKQNPELVEELIERELKPWLIKTNDPWLTGLTN
jgi:arylsulfatase A-like enzyme